MQPGVSRTVVRLCSRWVYANPVVPLGLLRGRRFFIRHPRASLLSSGPFSVILGQGREADADPGISHKFWFLTIFNVRPPGLRLGRREPRSARGRRFFVPSLRHPPFRPPGQPRGAATRAGLSLAGDPSVIGFSSRMGRCAVPPSQAVGRRTKPSKAELDGPPNCRITEKPPPKNNKTPKPNWLDQSFIKLPREAIGLTR
jgi:hypothetical protein